MLVFLLSKASLTETLNVHRLSYLTSNLLNCLTCSKLKHLLFLTCSTIRWKGYKERRMVGVLREGTSRSEAEGNRGEERKRGPERGE